MVERGVNEPGETANGQAVHLQCGVSLALPPGSAGVDSGALVPCVRALSIGARRFPIAVSIMQPVRAGIGSQIALKMSVDASVDEPIRALVNDKVGDAMELLRLAFRESNKRVYEYAHRMGQGGNIAATGLMAVYDGQKMAVGCVGSFAAYLVRQGRVLNFLQEQVPMATVSGEARLNAGVMGRFIGANAKILVDLASTQVEEKDMIVLASVSPEPWVGELVNAAITESTKESLATDSSSRMELLAKRLSRDILHYRQSRLPALVSELKAVVCVTLQVGPQAITLF